MAVLSLISALDPTAKLLFGVGMLVIILLALFILVSVNYWAKKRYLPRKDEKKTSPETPDPWAEAAKRIQPDDEA